MVTSFNEQFDQHGAWAREFAALLTPDLDSEYLGRAGNSRVLRLILRGYWRAVNALL